ncbi:MAG: diacylglycerol kinase family lipid kinase [Bacteroidota bacterium]|nr:diacylglycerol kinase family lipid kinase [Bacteroidota bacterium]
MSNKQTKYHFILNPVAGRGRAYKAIKQIRSLLREKGVNHTFSITSAPKHATQLANEAQKDYDVIVAIGGDGTVNEVMNGMVNSKIRFGVIPLGSGNDFARAVKMPNNLIDAIDIILNNKNILADVGKVITHRQIDDKLEIYDERYFINGIGIGFDASVAYESSKIKRLRGLPLYIFALFRALLKYQTPNFLFKLDELHLKSKYFLIAIGNGVSAGGGFYLTPGAKLDDNKFDVCYVEHVGFFKILKMFPSVLKGLHGKYKEVQFSHAQNIEVKSDENFFVHADGEIVGNNVNTVKISLIPAAIHVITG